MRRDENFKNHQQKIQLIKPRRIVRSFLSLFNQLYAVRSPLSTTAFSGEVVHFPGTTLARGFCEVHCLHYDDCLEMVNVKRRTPIIHLS